MSKLIIKINEDHFEKTFTYILYRHKCFSEVLLKELIDSLNKLDEIDGWSDET